MHLKNSPPPFLSTLVSTRVWGRHRSVWHYTREQVRLSWPIDCLNGWVEPEVWPIACWGFDTWSDKSCRSVRDKQNCGENCTVRSTRTTHLLMHKIHLLMNFFSGCHMLYIRILHNDAHHPFKMQCLYGSTYWSDLNDILLIILLFHFHTILLI